MTAPRRRHIAIVTGSRADYGLLSGLAREIAADPDCRLTVVATGTHLSARFGMTVDEIRRDGFDPVAVPCLDDGDSRLDMALASARALAGLAEALAQAAPELVVVLGDRFEILAAAQAALLLGIPLAHLHGGEVTEGAVDESIRHANTKMASLHFVAAAPYARRVVRMGEPPDRVFTVGAPGVDAVAEADATLADSLQPPLRPPVFLVTYHPVTLRQDSEAVAVAALLRALDAFPQARVVVTGVNADAGNRQVAALMDQWVAANCDRASLHVSLGQRRYLAAMKRSACVIGNSSSGLIEAPAAGVPTVNIGDRQAGRLRGPSVIDCAEDTAAIVSAIARALDPDFRRLAFSTAPPYGGGGVARAVLDVLKRVDPAALTRKPFHDGTDPS